MALPPERQALIRRRLGAVELERAVLGDGDMGAAVELELAGGDHLFAAFQAVEDHHRRRDARLW